MSEDLKSAGLTDAVTDSTGMGKGRYGQAAAAAIPGMLKMADANTGAQMGGAIGTGLGTAVGTYFAVPQAGAAVGGALGTATGSLFDEAPKAPSVPDQTRAEALQLLRSGRA
jgi:hypothetical protein